MQRALDSAIGFRKRPISASWMLAFLMPAEVRRYFIVPFLIGAQQFSSGTHCVANRQIEIGACASATPFPVNGEESFFTAVRRAGARPDRCRARSASR